MSINALEVERMLVADKKNNVPVTRSKDIKHGDKWLDSVIATMTNFVTPEMFGAVGDGVTDDRQAFVDAIGSNSNCVKLSKGKTYIISSPISINKSNFALDGNGATIKISNSASDIYSVLNFGNNSERSENIKIKNLTIDSNGMRTGIDIKNSDVSTYNACVAIANVDNVTIDNCTFLVSGVWGIFCGNSKDSPICNGFTLSNSRFVSTVGRYTTTNYFDSSCVYTQCSNVNIYNNILTGTSKNRTGLELHNNYNHNIYGNKISGYETGIIVINEANNTGDYGTIITDNIIKDVERGVNLWAFGTTLLSDVTISSNQFVIDANHDGELSGHCGAVMTNRNVSGSHVIQNVDVSNNIVKQKSSVTTASSGYLTNICSISFDGLNTRYDNVSIIGNTLENSSGISIVVTTAGATKGKNIKISDNKIINPCNNGTIPDKASGNLYHSAIRTGNTENVDVVDNLIVTNISSDKWVFNPACTNVNKRNMIVNNGVYDNKFSDMQMVKITADTNDKNFEHTEYGTIKIADDVVYIDNFIEITGETSGYAVYVVLPFTPTRNQNIPVVVCNPTSSIAAMLEIKSGNPTAYIRTLPKAFTAAAHLPTGSKICIHGTLYR